MDGFKNFYYEKNGKMILFFGFYLIFFVFLFFYMKTLNNNKPVEEPQEQPQEVKITTYNISNLINSEYTYDIEILDNEEVINFHGTKSNIDYANYSNKYFLDIYNINQLLKKSKLVNSENYVLSYELSNKEINEILLTDKKEANNQLMVFVNNKEEVNKIYLDLTNYMEKDKYQITISYIIGEENENSIS